MICCDLTFQLRSFPKRFLNIHKSSLISLKNSDNLSVFSETVQFSDPYMIICHPAEETTFHIMVDGDATYELSSFESVLIHLVVIMQNPLNQRHQVS